MKKRILLITSCLLFVSGGMISCSKKNTASSSVSSAVTSKAKQAKIVESSIDDVMSMHENNKMDKVTKYYVKGIKPYALSASNPYYEKGKYYAWFHNSDSSSYIATAIIPMGFSKVGDSGTKIVPVSSYLYYEKMFEEEESTKNCTVDGTYDLYFFLMYDRGYNSVFAEVVSYYPPVTE